MANSEKMIVKLAGFSIPLNLLNILYESKAEKYKSDKIGWTT